MAQQLEVFLLPIVFFGIIVNPLGQNGKIFKGMECKVEYKIKYIYCYLNYKIHSIKVVRIKQNKTKLSKFYEENIKLT